MLILQWKWKDNFSNFIIIIIFKISGDHFFYNLIFFVRGTRVVISIKMEPGSQCAEVKDEEVDTSKCEGDPGHVFAQAISR